MSELELALVDLGRRIEFPPTPDVAPRVRARLAEGGAPKRTMRRPYGHRRTLAIALAALAVAVGAVMAVPQTRAAILEFFHLRGVTIERVGTLPTVPVRNELGPLGKRVSLDEARELADFGVVVPEALGEPDEVYFWDGNPPGGMVSLVYGSREHPRAFVTEFRASVERVIFKKVATDTRVEQVRIDGDPGYFLSGSPHQFSYVDRYGEYREELVRLVGNTLVWERGPVTLRLEADVSKADALKIAHSVR
jgi:rRNA maturation protein Nop10